MAHEFVPLWFHPYGGYTRAEIVAKLKQVDEALTSSTNVTGQLTSVSVNGKSATFAANENESPGVELERKRARLILALDFFLECSQVTTNQATVSFC